MVDDNLTTLEIFCFLLNRAGFEAITAKSVGEGIAAGRLGYDVMLLDVRLGHEDGLEILRAAQHERWPGRVIVMTGFNWGDIEDEATALGAISLVHKWECFDVVDIVKKALPAAVGCGPPPTLVPVSVAVRWAELVAEGVLSINDPTTSAEWAHAVGKGHTSLREVCALADTSAKASLDLLRILRAVRLSTEVGSWNPKRWLNVGDQRTLRGLLARSGLSSLPHVPPPLMDDVLVRQNLVRNPDLLRELRRSLLRRDVAGLSP